VPKFEFEKTFSSSIVGGEGRGGSSRIIPKIGEIKLSSYKLHMSIRVFCMY
jgi:hypothetical protein